MIEVSLVAMLAGDLIMATPIKAPTVSPPASFFQQSWDKMGKTTKYKTVCTVTPGTLIKRPDLTADQEKNAALISAALDKLTLTETDAVIGADKKATAIREKSPSFVPYNAMLNDEIGYDEALNYTLTTPKFGVQFVVGPQGVYYRATSTNAWKMLKSKEMASSVMKNISANKITSGFDKASMSFDRWTTDKAPQAVYKGQMNAEGAKSAVADAVGSPLAGGGNQNEVKIYVDKATKNWKKMEATVIVDTGTLTFPLTKVCQFSYGQDVKIPIPAKAEEMELNAGAEEFLDLVKMTQ